MSDPIQAPQGIEQKLVFRSEQDRAAALEALDTAPAAGTSLDTWRREQDMAQDAIESAQIDPNYIPGQQSAAPPNVPGANPPAPALQEDDWYKPADWTLVQNGQNVTIGRDEIPTEFRDRKVANAKELVLELLTDHRYSQEKKNEYNKSLNDMQGQLSSMTKKMSDYEKQLEEARRNPGSPAPAATSLPSETEIGTAQRELAEIHETLDKMDQDDPENAPLLRKAVRLQGKLQDMKDKVHESRFNQLDEERKNIRQEAEQRRAEQERIAEEEKERQKREASESRMAREIETFGGAQKELKLSKPFKTVEKEYSDWATDIAATYWGIPAAEVTGDKAEVAVQHFLNRTPAFITKLQDTGKLNRVPTDLRKYLITTELYMMMQGHELDEKTGKWIQTDFRLPDMETAMDRWKRKKGLKYQELVTAANRAESDLLRVMNPPNLAEQIPANLGPQGNRDMSKLSKEEAQNSMDALERQAQKAGEADVDEWIEKLSRKNPGDERVLNYNRAFETLYAVQEK